MSELAYLAQWCMKERQKLSDQLAALEANTFRTQEMQGQLWVDSSHQSKEELRNSIADLDELLAEYTKSGTPG